jgi:hypothetical protein
VITGIAPAGSDQKVTWTVYGEPNTEYWFEYFSNLLADPSGLGEGKTHLGGNTLFTDERGIATVSITGPFTDQFLSATLTGPDGSTSEFSMVDSDADAIADTWETAGLGINVNEDMNSDGTPIIDFDFGAKGAHPEIKDIFLEWDEMENIHPTIPVPQQGALDQVALAFALSPVKNPAGSAVGIFFHAEDGGDLIPNEPDSTWSDLDAGGWPREYDREKEGVLPDHSDGIFGHPDERASPNWLNIRAAKRLVYHYAIFADTVKDLEGGRAEMADGLGGNDIVLAMGNWNVPGGILEDQAAALMHELGHNLGLGHGGADGDGHSDNTNFKPNYHSIMNYLWVYHASWMDEDLGSDGTVSLRADKNGDGDINDVAWSMTYSDRKFNDLDEQHLDETSGIGGHPDHWVNAGPLPEKRVSESISVDWNRDGDMTDTDVEEAELNRIKSGEGETGLEVLTGREDWSALRFYFVASPTSAADAHSALPDEIDFEEYLALRSLGEGPGFLGFINDFHEALETDGVVTVRVARAGGTDGEVTIDYATSDGSATDGLDYTGVSGTLTFGDQEFIKSFDVPILSDPAIESAETVILTLSSPAGGTMLGARNTATLTIADNLNPGTFQFELTTPAGNESDGVLEAVITRTGGSTGEAAVTLAASDISARAGSDYAATTQTLLFADGQTVATATVDLIDDAVTEPTESLYLELSNPTNGSRLGPMPLVRANIVDDARPS